MLKFSTKGDYGMVFMLELARNYGQRLVSLSEMSKRKRLSSNYLHQMILPLKKAGLVESKEGVKGGYFLARDPGEITLLEILEALEGPLALVQCQKNLECPGEPCCDAKSMWSIVQKDLRKYLQGKTLTDMARTSASIPVLTTV